MEFKNVTKNFGSFTAVSDLNLKIYRGEILGYLGENGAGKSTTMKMMANLLRPTKGQIYIRDNAGELEQLTSRSKDRLLNNIGFLIENPAFYGDMSPRAILKYFGELKGYPRDRINDRVEEVVEMIGMTKWIDVKIKNFSKGMRQKIGVVSAIVHNPDIVVLDEPQTGLDPSARLLVREFIMQLKDMGKTIFLSSHLLYEISEIADRIAIISHGKLVAIDTLENLEALGKLSVIHLELSTPIEEVPTFIPSIVKTIQPYLGEQRKTVVFDNKTGVIKIPFDGNPEHQSMILKELIRQGLDILEFSVPKAGLLEDLYIEFVNKRQEEL
ncbi:MAG: ABC transporter ATP-binding protein [Candidatus Lokiarchaeota archaeon]|nr:ABC transporter ATP-binding protein [Candidatus Lokiarchaeota archaeon]